MEAIRQNGKIILHSDEGTSIRMIFKNLDGEEFSRSGVCGLYPVYCNRDMGFSPGIIEHCRDGEGNRQRKNPECMKSGKSDEVAASSDFHLSDTLPCYGTYSSANSAFLRLSSMACRFPL